jgi:hypothetical protein
MVSPFSISFVKSEMAMSGRPHGPYTVKNRSPTLFRPWRLWYAAAICSPANFEIPYRFAGWSMA